MSEAKQKPHGEASDRVRLKDVLDGVITCAEENLKETSKRARENLEIAQRREYGFERWISDVAWFWGRVAENAELFAKEVTKQAPKKAK